MRTCSTKNLITASCCWLGLGLTVLLSGCASVSVQSVRDPSFSNPTHNLFIVVNHDQLDTVDPAYTQYLVPALKTEFEQRGIQTQIRVINPLALDESVYLSEIASYKPDGVLTIVANGCVVSPYGGAEQINYDISLFDPTRTRRIWRAKVLASGGTAVREKRMKLMAQDLVKRMSDEKLISSEPRKTGVNL